MKLRRKKTEPKLGDNGTCRNCDGPIVFVAYSNGKPDWHHAATGLKHCPHTCAEPCLFQDAE